MNCFTISYLLGSGNLRSMACCSHRNSGGAFSPKSLHREVVTHTQALCVCSSFYWKPFLSSASLPSLLPPHLSQATGCPTEQTPGSTKCPPSLHPNVEWQVRTWWQERRKGKEKGGKVPLPGGPRGSIFSVLLGV